MSKAILVLPEMPESCYNCILNYDMYMCVFTNNSTLCLDSERRDDCPLLPMPEEQKVCVPNDEYDEGYVHGWNACIEEIEGSGEDG